MTKIAIIGGTGLSSISATKIEATREVDTSYGQPSAALRFIDFSGKEIIFLPRHGDPHTIPPHKVNYRANIDALKQHGVETIIAVNAVGGITPDMYPGRIVIPQQIIDYTYGREQTFYQDHLTQVTHIDFTNPYSASLRRQLSILDVSKTLNVFSGGVYAATQGPRLETAAEINKLEKDGCDIVGMTGMPEASLAREVNIDYATLCLVVNWAAGKTDTEISMATIRQHLKNGMDKVRSILEQFIATSRTNY